MWYWRSPVRNRSLAPFIPIYRWEKAKLRPLCSLVGKGLQRVGKMVKCGRGGIGRRAGFRYQWRKSWGFESLRPHHLTAKIFAAFAAQVQVDRVKAHRVMPSVPEFRRGRFGQQIVWLRSLQIKPVWKNPIWLCRHITNWPDDRSWQDKG